MGIMQKLTKAKAMGNLKLLVESGLMLLLALEFDMALNFKVSERPQRNLHNSRFPDLAKHWEKLKPETEERVY